MFRKKCIKEAMKRIFGVEHTSETLLKSFGRLYWLQFLRNYRRCESERPTVYLH